MRFEGFIFDMDGTMLDTEKVSLEAIGDAAEEYGVSVPWEFRLELLGVPHRVLVERFYRLLGEDFDFPNFWKRKVELHYGRLERDGIAIKPGLTELLDYGKAHGIKLAVATSTAREKAEWLLNRSGIFPYFDCIICGDEIQNGKPNPEIFLKAAEGMGAAADRCVVFEDSRAGIQAAHHAGMFPILIPDLLEPDEEMLAAAGLCVESLKEAKEYIEKEL